MERDEYRTEGLFVVLCSRDLIYISFFFFFFRTTTDVKPASSDRRRPNELGETAAIHRETSPGHCVFITIADQNCPTVISKEEQRRGI